MNMARSMMSWRYTAFTRTMGPYIASYIRKPSLRLSLFPTRLIACFVTGSGTLFLLFLLATVRHGFSRIHYTDFGRSNAGTLLFLFLIPLLRIGGKTAP